MQRRTILVAAVVAAASLGALLPVLGNGFVDYDDSTYITGNEMVTAGLSWNGLVWAFTSAGYASNWHPLTWLSHMLDWRLFGPDPRGHHLVSLLLHAANAVILFLVIRGYTGALWRSALVAVLFGVHPLHVESVAWAAERKDVLSSLFWLAGLWAYLRQVRRPAAGRYLLTMFFLALGLMAKPMAMTFPFTVLILDFWPLGRFPMRAGGSATGVHPRAKTPLGPLLEKAPFLVLSALSAAITFFAQSEGGAVATLEIYPLGVRISNALISYARYIDLTFWPRHLAFYYPHAGGSLPAWRVAMALLFLAGAGILAVREARRRPYLLAGWTWYLLTLLPVIGLVQVGLLASADRYTYIPLIGIFIAVSWCLDGARGRRPGPALAGTTAAVLALALLSAGSWRQAGYWRDSITLFNHALSVTEDNWLAHNNLGRVYEKRGDPERSLAHYAEALRLKPGYGVLHYNVGVALAKLGRGREAGERFREAARLGQPIPGTFHPGGVP